MMAGVVAMASVIEDFDTQPCKKSHKDGSSAVVKTITNYFSPLPKPAEKSSPPRSNNIMDYFIRKASSSKEMTSSPEQLRDKCQTFQLDAEKHTSPEATVKQLSQKRRRKTTKAARKLVEAESVRPTDEESCFIVEEPSDNRVSTAEASCNCGVLGSDTAALLVHLSAEACITEGTSDGNTSKTGSEKDEHHEDGSKCGNNVKLKPELKELSPILPSKNKPKQVETVTRNPRKKKQQKAKHSEPDEKKIETSLCDVSMEVNVDESSQLNSSTVTISFEEFVRSQSQDRDEENIEDDSKITSDAEELDTEQLSTPKTEENIVSEKPPLQVSPRTVTFQAEVHVVSAKQEAKVVGKVASIFNRRKTGISPAEVESSQVEAGQQLPSTSLTVKRKSNVVLQEEDLELAVLESELTAKCSGAERKQFMAAFKQASLSGSKTKLGKSQGNQKQPGEKVLDDVDKAPEEGTLTPTSIEQIPDSSPDNKVATKKPTRKGLKKAKGEKEAALAPPVAVLVEDTVATTVEISDEGKEPPITSTPSVPTVRRSKRGAAVRQAPEAVSAAPARKSRKPKESKDAAGPSTNDSPAEMSTPKLRRSKCGVFVAEMVCPPDTKQSPIRIKFTRVHKNVPVTKAESGSVINSSLANKITNDSKKRKQAKKLLEKARTIQQSKKAAVEDKGTFRRSSRTEASAKKTYCEDEDSVICLEEDHSASPQTAPGRRDTQKSLRSLNDVLGKATPVGKETKPVSGSKVALLSQEKAARRASEVICIFEDDGPEDSENSQNVEQFRARREFLKSGLPESFRKQMAKTAATKEAYSLSCSSFQPVIHVKQMPKDCPLWSLLWPESSSLSHLKELWSQASNPLPSVCGSFHARTEPARRAFYQRGSGWRPEISESVRQLLTEEVGTSNPQFPVQMFITRFLKRRADHQHQCTATEPEALTRLASATLSADPVVGKRKRMDDEGELPVTVAKKQRANSSGEKLSTAEPEPTKRGGRTRRGRRSRSEKEGEDEATPSVKAAPIPPVDESVVVLLREDAGRNDEVKEDMLWTDKYQPQHSNDIIGNPASVKRLHSWLKEWKLRADREESKKQKDKKHEEDGSDSDWGCGEEDSQDGEDMLCNTVLITGPTGVGKTAAVYACAQELGFKVFEVNASSQRSGRLILSQLKEATQSHQVDSQGVNAHKPAYFNSYGTSSSAGSLRPGSSPRKVNSPARVSSSPRRHPQSPRAAKRGGLAPTSLANFFKIGRPTNKETANTKKTEQAADSKNVTKTSECGSKRKSRAVKPPTAATPRKNGGEEQSKKTATSLILFEEVDVIFADDSGFLAAVKTFMTTTKRPVILTTSDPAFSAMFDGDFEEINFKAPSLSDAGCFLRLLCLAEDTRIDQRDVSSVLRLNGCDMRQSLLQLQFWARSGGGRHATQPLPHTGKKAEVKPESEEVASMSVCGETVPSALPPCETRCTESMLGLLNIEPERDIWELLGSHRLMEEALCWELLTSGRQRGVNLLYSNMERLLSLPLSQLTTSTRKLQQCVSVPQHQPSVDQTELPSHASLLQTAESADRSDDGSAVKLPDRPDQNGLQSDSDSEDSFLSLRKPQGPPQTEGEVKESVLSETVKRKPLTPEERLKNLPVSQCLESIAEFLDNTSYMDTSFLAHSEGGDAVRGLLPVVKDGMTDEMRVETDRWSWVNGEHTLEIQAAVEALSFHKCRVSTAEAWDQAQQLGVELGKETAAELSLPVAAHRDGCSLTHDGPCEPQLVERRREVMERLMSRGVFGTQGNRPAAALDYMPALRTICRSEQLKEQGKVKRRFLHYLDAIHLGLEKSTLQQLAEDFP
uniref:Atad5a n=1 Tax=Haplophryne mollis TaxID=412653 RepID=A0AA49JIA0_HAPMO|nr:Atad5a [Haplophryne mollis]